MPVYERVHPVTASMNAPTAIALDKNECLFVAESINSRVLIYSQSGQYLNTISGLQRPISVAVDDSIRAYVGNKDSGNVEVYDADLNLLFKLGTGDGEFTQPASIALDKTTGKVYVADSEEDKIKVYNSDGSPDFQFGSNGSGNGQFNFPTSIAIDEVNKEIFISDLQVTLDMFGKPREGARIQVFDINGGFKRAFGTYGVGEGLIAKPMGVSVDKESRVYVTDSFQNVVHVFNNSGSFLGTVFDIAYPLRTPLGISIGGSNRLYIASLTAGKVEVYGIDMYTQMAVTPLSLNFQGVTGGSSPALQSVTISNSGTGALDWTAMTGESWINISDASGAAQASGSLTLDIGVNLNGLTAGTYTGGATITASTGAAETVNVTLIVSEAPELSVTPSSLTYTITNGSNAGTKTLSIANAGGGMLQWSAAKDRSWIVLDKSSGTGADTVAVTVDASSLVAGAYRGAITVTAQGAGGSPAATGVTLNIVEITGSISVTASVAGATFTINGPASYSGGGTSWTQAVGPVGIYAIVYGDVTGYTTPSSESRTLQSNGTINFHGEYSANVVQQQSGEKNIIVGAGAGEQNTGVVKVYRADGTETGVEFVAHGYMYGVNVAAGDLDNDGVDEIITGPGGGADNPAEIKVYDRNGNHLSGLDITAFQYKYGVNVASGDFDGDGNDEVVAGAGGGEGNPAEVKVFVYDGVNNVMVDSGINLLAYGTGYGVRVAAGDIDGDGADELITVPGFGEGNTGEVKIWSIDDSLGIGQWTTQKVKEYTVTYPYNNSISITAGDITGDGYAEIVTGAGHDRAAMDEIQTFTSDGDLLAEYRTYLSKRYGVNVASGDLDNDGVSEIIAGAGPAFRNRAIIMIFDANGTEQARFKTLRTMYGVNVAVGDLAF